MKQQPEAPSRVTNVLTLSPGARAACLPSIKEQMLRDAERIGAELPSDCEPYQAPERDPA